MKKIILSICVAAGLFSCTSEADQKAKVGAENVAYYSRVWEVAINEGRTNILDSAYTEDAVLHTVPEVKGKANCKAYYENFVSGHGAMGADFVNYYKGHIKMGDNCACNLISC